MPVGEQVAVLYCGMNNLLSDVAIDKIPEFEKLFLEVMRSRYRTDVIEVLENDVMNDAVAGIIRRVVKEITDTLKHAG